MPIETAIEQAAIEDSLVDDSYGVLGSVNELFDKTEASTAAEIEEELAPEQGAEPQADWRSDYSPADFGGDEQKYQQWMEMQERLHEQFDQEREAEDPIEKFELEQRDEMAQQLADEQLQQTPEEPSETYAETIERLDLRSQEGDAIAGELAQGLGAQTETSEQMGGLLRFTALSAATHGMQGNFSQEVRDTWVSQLYASAGIDPQFSAALGPEQKTYMTGSVHNAFANIKDTADALEEQGITPTVETVNRDPGGAIGFGRIFFGGAAGLNREQINNLEQLLTPDQLQQLDQLSVWLGNKLTAFYLDMRNRSIQAGQEQERPAQPKGKRGKIQTFETNDDIFDAETMERIANERAL